MFTAPLGASRRRRLSTGVYVAVVLIAITLSSCSSDADGDRDKPGANSSSVTEVQNEYDVPEECQAMMAFDKADIGDVGLVPSDWPTPPVDATLCKAEPNADNTTGVLTYATEADPAEVLDGYRQSLAGYSIEEGSDNTQLTGSTDETLFSVVATDGQFSITFASR